MEKGLRPVLLNVEQLVIRRKYTPSYNCTVYTVLNEEERNTKSVTPTCFNIIFRYSRVRIMYIYKYSICRPSGRVKTPYLRGLAVRQG